MSFPRYPEYKDSRIGFLGKIPTHWALKRLKHCAEVFPSNVDKKSVEGQVPVKLCNYTDVYYNDTIDAELNFMSATATKAQIRRFELQQGDVVFTKDSESANDIGVAALVPHSLPGVIYGYHLSIARAQDFVSGNFLKRYFDSKETKAYFETSANGLTRVGLGQYAVDNAPIALPSLGEQTQIARFLDHETAKIDALIHEQERLIELLQEKRQAVISHAVTKGMDPNVPMKDSGVEWLGEVPAHWRVGKLRWYATIQGGLAKGKEYRDQKTVSLPYLRVANVQAGYVDLTEVKDIAVLESEVARYRLRHGDVLMNEGGDNDKLGRGTVWKAEIEPCLHQNHVFAIRPNEHLKPEWLAMFTQSSRARSYFFLNSKQSTNLASISSSNVMNLDLPMPPVQEQEEILRLLEAGLQRFADLQKQADNGIQLLTERRSALISAAVTGKIDVRNWRPPTDESAFDLDTRRVGIETTA